MHSFYPIRIIKSFFYLKGLNTRDKRVMFTKIHQTFTSSYPFCDASKDVVGGVLKHLKSQSRFLSLLFKLSKLHESTTFGAAVADWYHYSKKILISTTIQIVRYN